MNQCSVVRSVDAGWCITSCALLIKGVNGKFTPPSNQTLIYLFTDFWVYLRDQTREQSFPNRSTQNRLPLQKVSLYKPLMLAKLKNSLEHGFLWFICQWLKVFMNIKYGSPSSLSNLSLGELISMFFKEVSWSNLFFFSLAMVFSKNVFSGLNVLVLTWFLRQLHYEPMSLPKSI